MNKAGRLRSLAAGAIDASAGPRFALRFEAGRGVLALAKPMRVAGGVLEALELTIAVLRFPLDVTAGAIRFRTSRTRVVSAVVRLDVRAIERAAAARGVRLRVLFASADGRLSLGIVDAFGALAVELDVAPEGPDLVAAVREVRAAVDAPEPAWARALGALRTLGVVLDEERGLLLLARPLRATLREALVAQGWRAPDERGTELTAPTLEDGLVTLSLSRRPTDRARAGRWLEAAESARSLAPALVALALGDRDKARAAVRDARGRLGDGIGPARDSLTRLGASLDADSDEGAAGALASLAGLGDAGALLGTTVAFRIALRARDADGAARAARAIDAGEVSPDVAFDALAAAARLAGPARAASALDLWMRASARRPDDLAALEAWIDAAARGGPVDALERALERAIVGASSEPARATLAISAARSLDRSGDHDRAARLWARALDYAPENAEALGGHAEALLRRGELEDALVALERAAELRKSVGDTGRAALAYRRAAAALAALGRHDACAERLERATALDSGVPDAWLELARARLRMGDAARAAVALSGLLALAPRLGASLAGALAEAATMCLERLSDTDAARPFVTALARVAPTDARFASLERTLAVRSADRWLETPDRLLGADAGLLDDVARNASDPAQAGVVLLALTERAAASGGASAAALREATLRAALRSDDRGLAERAVDAALGAGHQSRDPAVAAALDARASEHDPARARARAAELKERGQLAAAARVLARAAVSARDAALVRAALELAERGSEWQVALEIVDLALGLLGGGARDALLARRAEIVARLEK